LYIEEFKNTDLVEKEDEKINYKNIKNSNFAGMIRQSKTYNSDSNRITNNNDNDTSLIYNRKNTENNLHIKNLRSKKSLTSNKNKTSRTYKDNNNTNNNILQEEKNNCFLKIEVVDTGIGISEEKQAQMFNKNIKVNTDYDFNQQGSGLGLSICLSLVKILNMKIIFSSKENVGSIFSVLIPSIKKRNSSKTLEKSTYIPIRTNSYINNTIKDSIKINQSKIDRTTSWNAFSDFNDNINNSVNKLNKPLSQNKSIANNNFYDNKINKISKNFDRKEIGNSSRFAERESMFDNKQMLDYSKNMLGDDLQSEKVVKSQISLREAITKEEDSKNLTIGNNIKIYERKPSFFKNQGFLSSRIVNKSLMSDFNLSLIDEFSSIF